MRLLAAQEIEAQEAGVEQQFLTVMGNINQFMHGGFRLSSLLGTNRWALRAGARKVDAEEV